MDKTTEFEEGASLLCMLEGIFLVLVLVHKT